MPHHIGQNLPFVTYLSATCMSLFADPSCPLLPSRAVFSYPSIAREPGPGRIQAKYPIHVAFAPHRAAGGRIISNKPIYGVSTYDVELDIRTPEDPCQGRAAQLSRMLVSIGCPTLVRAANYKQARAPFHAKGVLARPARRTSHGSVFIINLSNARVTSTAES